ncbi:MAG: PorP/SprF family type IX secretion system membrane protein [Bacteroidales bacterium]
MRKIYILLLVLGLSNSFNLLYGQIDPGFSRRGLNQEIYNPAYILPENIFRLGLTTRQQWAGFEHAPLVHALNFTDFIEPKRFGVGLSVVNLSQGIESYQNIKLKYAYQLWLKNDIVVSMGIGAGVINHRLKNSDLVFEKNGDPMQREDYDKLSPDFDIGVCLFAKRIEAGFSISHLERSNKKASNDRVPRHQYAYAAYCFDISEDVKLKPMIAYRGIRKVAKFEASVSGSYRNFIGADLGYSFNRDLFFSLSIAPIEWAKLVYSFDIDMGELRAYDANIHEISLIFKLRKRNLLHKSPRFFD